MHSLCVTAMNPTSPVFMEKQTVHTRRTRHSVSASPTRGITDYTVTCYDRLELNEHGGEAATLTCGGLSWSLLRHFYDMVDIRYFRALYVTTSVSSRSLSSVIMSSWQDTGVVYLKKSVAVSLENVEKCLLGCRDALMLKQLVGSIMCWGTEKVWIQMLIIG